MSLLPDQTFYNPTTSFFGSGGGSGGSTLQSPASITPDGTGAATLLIASTTGGTEASLVVSNTTGNDAIIYLQNIAGGNSLIEMGLAASTVGIIAPSANPGQLGIGASVGGVVANPNLLVDTSANGVAVSNTLSVVNVAYLPNSVTIIPQSATASIITQTCVSGGTVTLGTSNTNTAAIVMTDTATTINNLGGAPEVLLASTTLPAQTPPAQYNTTFPTPSTEGLWCITACCQSTNQPSRQAQFSVVCYVNNARQVQMGGSALGDVGAIGSTDGLLVYPQQGGQAFNLAYTGASATIGFSIVAFKLSGPIPGTF
jgi:hypothetical protein